MVDPVYETPKETRPNPIIFSLSSIFFLLLGICLIVFGIYIAYRSIVFDGYPIWIIAVFLVFVFSIAGFVFMFEWVSSSAALAIYRFDENGLWAKYPFHDPILILWGDFQQVCVLYAAYTTCGRPRACSTICCVKMGEKKNGRGRWKTDNLFRYRSVICIPYTPELYEGIKIKCPYEVPDLRQTLTYRLPK